MDYREATQVQAHILNDPTASDWLRNALRTSQQRDIVDVTHDAVLLAAILQARCDFCLGTKRKVQS